MARKKITIPFSDEFYNIQGTICDFPVKDYCKWFQIHGFEGYTTQEEEDMHYGYFSCNFPNLPKELIDAVTPEEVAALSNSKYWYDLRTWMKYSSDREDPNTDRKTYMEEFKNFCIAIRAEHWAWGDTKPELTESVKYSFDLAELNMKLTGGIPYPIPHWVFCTSATPDDTFYLNQIQIFAIAIITYFTQRRPDRGYLEYLGFIEAYTKSTPMDVKEALNDLYARDIIIPVVNDPRVCYGAMDTISWVLNVPTMEERLNSIGLSLNGAMNFAKNLDID